MTTFKQPKFCILAFLFIASLSLVAFIPNQSQDDWDVPEKYKKMENPYKGQDVQTGKMLYNKHCKMCHGRSGEAGTPKARQMNYKGKLFGQAFTSQSDGVIYYKSIIGRPETGMPNYEKKIRNERDRWAVVNYMRTFEKK